MDSVEATEDRLAILGPREMTDPASLDRRAGKAVVAITAHGWLALWPRRKNPSEFRVSKLTILTLTLPTTAQSEAH